MKKLFALIVIPIMSYSLLAAPPAEIQQKRVECVKINRCLIWNRATDQTKCVLRQVSAGKTHCPKWRRSKYTVFGN